MMSERAGSWTTTAFGPSALSEPVDFRWDESSSSSDDDADRKRDPQSPTRRSFDDDPSVPVSTKRRSNESRCESRKRSSDGWTRGRSATRRRPDDAINLCWDDDDDEPKTWSSSEKPSFDDTATGRSDRSSHDAVVDLCDDDDDDENDENDENVQRNDDRRREHYHRHRRDENDDDDVWIIDRPPSQRRDPYADPSLRHMATERIPSRSSAHSRRRRVERGVGSRDLRAALKHGRRRPGARPGTWVYEHRGRRFVVVFDDDGCPKEITCYEPPADAPRRRADEARHSRATARTRNAGARRRSHSVCVVDAGGNARASDVRGDRSRIGSAARALAVDVVGRSLASGAAGDEDSVSVVCARDKQVEVLLDELPTDEVLYNALLDLSPDRRDASRPIRPCRARFANAAPALDWAERSFAKQHPDTPLALTVLSHGQFREGPPELRRHLKRVVRRFGPRLSVTFVGIGSSADFGRLRGMVRAANDAMRNVGPKVATLALPSNSPCLAGRCDAHHVLPPRVGLNNNDDDNRFDATDDCDDDAASSFPFHVDVVDDTDFHVHLGPCAVRHREYDPVSRALRPRPLQHPDAVGLAVSKRSFAMGTQRCAHACYEVAADGRTVVGEPLVAKIFRRRRSERPHERDNDGDSVLRDCAVQHTARRLARAFNDALDKIPALDESTPRVSFLDCSLYDVRVEGGRADNDDERRQTLLVERRLPHTFQKWNDNRGSVRLETLDDRERRRGDGDVVVVDGDDDRADVRLFVGSEEVAQAFSHFSHHHSREQLLVCDLQGCYDRAHNFFRFTDPVVHSCDDDHDDDDGGGSAKRTTCGPTDRGRRGMDAFLDTHRCNRLCEIVTKGLRCVE